MLVIGNMLFVMERDKWSLLYSILVFKWHSSLWWTTSLNSQIFFPAQYFSKYFLALSVQLQAVQVLSSVKLLPSSPRIHGYWVFKVLFCFWSGKELSLQVTTIANAARVAYGFWEKCPCLAKLQAKVCVRVWVQVKMATQTLCSFPSSMLRWDLALALVMNSYSFLGC